MTVTEQSSPLEQLRRDLVDALTSGLPGSSLSGLRVLTGGRSALTAVGELERAGLTQQIAVRATLPNADSLSIASLTDQYALLERLQDEHVFAPRPIMVSQGRPGATYDVLVTDFLDGEAPHPWRSAGRRVIGTLRRNARFRRDFVEVLARIHAVSPSHLPVGIAADGSESARSHPCRSLQRSKQSIAASTVFVDDPVLTYTGLWMEAHRPRQQFAAGLVHGDYRMGNLLVNADNRLCGVLDWELAEAGETLSDVAWLCGPQGQIDGHPAGLFTRDELVTDYEAATGRRVDADLFDYLTVEGTLRTSAVWAQLSINELRRGDTAMAARCRDSVLEMIAACARVAGLADEIEATPTAPAADLLQAVSEGAALIRADLDGELAAIAGPAGPSARNASLFLHRLTRLSEAAFSDYADECLSLAHSYRTDHPDFDPPRSELPAAHLSAVLRHQFADPSTTARSHAASRRLVAWSARGPIVFANLLLASARGVLDTLTSQENHAR